jgi:hypothetical protein
MDGDEVGADGDPRESVPRKRREAPTERDAQESLRVAINPAALRMVQQIQDQARLALNPALARMLEQFQQQARLLTGSAVVTLTRQMQDNLRLATNPAWEQVARTVALRTEHLRGAVEAFARMALLIYPENLRGIDGLSLEEVEAVVMTDGIPLYRIPRPSIAAALIMAPTRADRRAVLGRRWLAIANDCEALLDGCFAPDLAQERRFAIEAIATLKDGHAPAAQALAANLLETIVTFHFADDRVGLKPGKHVKSPDGYDDFIARKFWALAPVWSAYQQFWPSNGDKVPRDFARHATAHAVTAAQFSRRNAVQSVMLVSSLVAYLADEIAS